ncbi:serine hydrolase domain-containing protein [Streptomyces klenkii]|uniref:serine hydrolase domain-containing protein n=1 Tax=Streptomyces klenkii TaxID=1420899 RepID=UPI0033BF3A31
MRYRAGLTGLAVAAVLAPAAGAAAYAQPASAGVHLQQEAASYNQQVLQGDLDELVQKDGVVGAEALMVTGSGWFAAVSGVGDRETSAPMPAQGYFRMGSNTKTFVATAILQLVGEGRMGLDDTVERWLPKLITGNDNDGSRITVRHLLQHTSGLFNYTADKAFSAGDADQHYQPEQLVKVALNHKPTFQPGAPGEFEYSNTNYVLAGMIIKSVTGNDWREQVRTKIIEPLGLAHTFSPKDDPKLPAPHAKGYYRMDKGGPLVDTTEMDMSWGDAAGDLVTTSDDLIRFWQGLLGGKLLKPEQKAEMLKTVTTKNFIPGAEYGLGIMKRPLAGGGSYWGHGGTVPGHLNDNGFSEDGKRGIVLLRSSNDPDLGDKRDERTDRLIEKALRKAR